jgi:catechol 2,3-dioxygenase-like lactoylglutathione lyase family enzyme
MAPRLDRIDHIHVFVTDRAAAQRWYAATLGLAPVPELQGWVAGGGPLTLADAAHRVHLALFERPVLPCRSTVAFGVDAAAFLAWRTHLAEALPAPIRIEDHQMSWSIYFADPDGNPFEITTYDYAEVATRLA